LGANSSNVANLQASNALVWSRVEANSSNVANLQASNALVWTRVEANSSNVANLQVSNTLAWSNISNLHSNPLVKTSWDLPTLASGDLLYVENETKLTRLGIGATGTVLTSAGSEPTWQALAGGTMTFNNYHENGTNTGISNVQPGTTLSVGSNLFIQDTGTDVLYVNGNVYVRRDLIVLDTITASTIRSQRSFVKNTTVVVERPPSIRRITITQNP
jgi:hypothetical protein